MLPLSSMTEQQRERERESIPDRHNSINADRQPEIKQLWILTYKGPHVTSHGSLFPFSDNLTTLMFIVGKGLDEARRERLTSSLSLRNITVTAYTLDTVQPFFVELFCTPRSSMLNPSLRVSGQGGSMNRTFITENYPEDDYGLWAIDEATGAQSYVGDERWCFWTWDDNEHAWQSRKFQNRQVKRRKSNADLRKTRQ